MSVAVVATENGTLTNAGGNTDLISIAPADDKPVALCRFILSQSSELGDSAEESLRITVKRLNTFSVGSGGGTVDTLKVPDSAQGTTIGATVRANDTTVATGASTDTLLDVNWNIRGPLEIVWPDERFRPTVRGTEGVVIVCESTAADDLTFSITVEFLEG